MPKHETRLRVETAVSQKHTRNVALITLGIAFLIAILTWIGLSNAADSGVARLARIDQARAACDSGWSRARSFNDTVAIDMSSLSDTIDPGSSAELSRCGHLRRNGLTTGTPNRRDLTK